MSRVNENVIERAHILNEGSGIILCYVVLQKFCLMQMSLFCKAAPPVLSGVTMAAGPGIVLANEKKGLFLLRKNVSFLLLL